MNELTKRQQEVLSVSVDLFHRNGYVETSMRDIAAVLKVKAASLYAHIESKEQILEWTCDEVKERFMNMVNEIKKSGLEGDKRFELFISKYIKEVFVSPERFYIYRKYSDLLKNKQNEYEENFEFFFTFSQEVIEAVVHKSDVSLFIYGAHVRYILDILNNLPKWVRNYREIDLDFLTKLVITRIYYGYSVPKDWNINLINTQE